MQDRRDIRVSTYGILFMGTPHQGSEGVTWGVLARNLVSIFTNTNKEILEHLAKNSEWLEYQQALFLPISDQFKTIYLYETYPTPYLSGSGALLVCSSEDLVPGIHFGPDSDNLIPGGTKTLGLHPRSSGCCQDRYLQRPHQYGQIR